MGIDVPSWSRDPHKMICLGLNLSLPIDLLPEGKYRALENVRPYGEGQILGRPGILIASSDFAPSPIHSIKLLNDPVPSPSQFPGFFLPLVFYIGNGTELRRGVPVGAAPTPVTLAQLVDSGFSGNPLGMVVVRPSFSPRPWICIADSTKMREQSSCFQDPNQWGIAAPNDPPTAALGAGNVNGPDTGGIGIPYVYRYAGRRASDVQPGDFGNAGPPMRLLKADGTYAGIDARQQNIVVTIVTVHPDPAVAYLDIYRFGGSLLQWTYVGTVTNTAGAVLTDTLSDSAIAANHVLEEDNFQPFPTFDPQFQGQCTITPNGGGQSGGVLTITSGGQFRFYDPANLDKPYYGFGNQILVHGQAFTFYRSPTSATTVELVETPTVAGGKFTCLSPEIWHQPLPFIWGPFGGGFTGVFIFACGDALDLGALKWTKGNAPGSAPDTNRLNITSPSEPLQNGCMYGGNAWVFSSERLFQIYPTFGQGSDFIAIEVPNSKGLFMRWCLCVGKKGVYFRARDGIYRTAGAAPDSLTDADLYSIFPHESATSSFVVDGQNISPNLFGGDFSPPDDTLETAQRLFYADGFVYYEYIDQGGTRRTLVFNEETDSWVSRDTYTPHLLFHYQEEGGPDYADNIPIHQVICGAEDGNLYVLTANTSDNGAPIAGRIRTRACDQNDPRPRKLYGDILLDFDSVCETMDVTAGFDNYTFFSVLTLTGTNLTGRRRSILDIAAGLGQYAANIGLEIDWTTTGSRAAFYFWEPSFLPRPEVTILRATDWTDDGYVGAKFFQGMYIEGDSLNAPRTLNVQADGGGVEIAALQFSTSNRQELVYSFAQPFVSRLVRLVPTDNNQWRLFKIRWIWEPAPDLAANWVTQGTTHDFTGFFHHRDGYFSIIASQPVQLTVQRLDDGAGFVYTIPATTIGSLYQQKQYITFRPMKAKEVSYIMTSPGGFRLFVKDTGLRVGQWGRGDAYRVVQPFGDVSREKGAII